MKNSIFNRKELNKIKKIIEKGAVSTAEEFKQKMDEVKEKINELFDHESESE